MAAAKLYTDAYNLADELGNSVEKERAEAVDGVSSTRLSLAIAAAKAGEFKEADLQIKQARKADPANVQVINFQKENDRRLEDQAGKRGPIFMITGPIRSRRPPWPATAS
jgi:hypothetical protein